MRIHSFRFKTFWIFFLAVAGIGVLFWFLSIALFRQEELPTCAIFNYPTGASSLLEEVANIGRANGMVGSQDKTVFSMKKENIAIFAVSTAKSSYAQVCVSSTINGEWQKIVEYINTISINKNWDTVLSLRIGSRYIKPNCPIREAMLSPHITGQEIIKILNCEKH